MMLARNVSSRLRGFKGIDKEEYKAEVSCAFQNSIQDPCRFPVMSFPTTREQLPAGGFSRTLHQAVLHAQSMRPRRASVCDVCTSATAARDEPEGLPEGRPFHNGS
jgi:hypothetical protein